MKVKLLYDDGGLVEVDGVRVVHVVGKGNIEEEDATPTGETKKTGYMQRAYMVMNPMAKARGFTGAVDKGVGINEQSY